MHTLPDIRFRALEPRDIDTLYEAENDSAAWVSSETVAPYSRHTLASYIESTVSDPVKEGQLRLIAEDAATGSTVGILDFYEYSLRHRRSFVGVYTLTKYRKQGYGEAMVREADRYAAEWLGCELLAARILADNEESLRLFERCGYSRCATLGGWHYASGRRHDVLILTRHLSRTA